MKTAQALNAAARASWNAAPPEVEDAMHNQVHEIFNVVALLRGAICITEGADLEVKDKNENVRRVLHAAIDRLDCMNLSLQPFV